MASDAFPELLVSFDIRRVVSDADRAMYSTNKQNGEREATAVKRM